MHHGHTRLLPDLDHAAQVARRDHIRLARHQAGDLALAQVGRDFGLQNVIRPRRSAAQMAVDGFADLKARLRQQVFGQRLDLLAVL